MPNKRRYKGHFKAVRPNKPPVQHTQSHVPKKRGISWYVIHAFASLSGLAVSTVAGNMLNGITSTWAFVVVMLALCILLGYWTWVLTPLAKNLPLIGKREGRVASILVVVCLVVFVSPSYIGRVITNQGTIEMPTFVDASQLVTVHYGSAEQAFWTQVSIEQLEQEGGESPLKINGEEVFNVHINDRKLYIDAVVFAGIADPERHIFFPPIRITNNNIDGKPNGWMVFRNNMNLEIDNAQGIPVLVLEYKNPYQITISGLFDTPMGICKVDNHPGQGYAISDNLTGLGEYKVDRVFVHSIFDLFRRERTYTLR